MIAQATLGRTARDVVLDPIPGEHLDRPVVETHREVDGHLAPRRAQDRADVGIEREVVGGGLELLDRGGQRSRRHGVPGGAGSGRVDGVIGHRGRFSGGGESGRATRSAALTTTFADPHERAARRP